MGFDDGQIELDSESGAYYAGQTVNGQIVFDQKKHKTIHGIYVSLKGFCSVHWTTRKSRRENDRTHYYTVDHTSYEEYVKQKVFIVGNSNGEHDLQAGKHAFNFALNIPANCPSSFEGKEGHVRYRIKAVMLTTGMFSSNKELFAAVSVVAPTNLNDNPYCKEPIEFEMSQSYCCWCFNSGSSELTVKLPASGYCPGEVIPIEVSCENKSSVDITQIKFAIKRYIKFIAESEPDTREEKETLAVIKKGPVPGNTTRNWTVEMEVPEMDVYNMDECRYIDIDYFFKVSTKASGCHSDQDESQPIIFGTIPLQDTQQEELPKQIQQVTSYPVPIMNQPLPTSPYPNNQVYPNNQPYPAVNAPYPNTPINQPYPNANPVSPYPAGNQNDSPYPPNNQPYPGNPLNQNISPFPQTNQAYPGTPNHNVSPYPQVNQTYPGNTPNQNISPYPQPNQGYCGIPNQNVAPYPETNQSYPSVNPPYPINSPYLGNSTVPPHRESTHSPVPPYSDNRAVTSTSLVTTGSMGFAMPGGDGVPPSLPPGANVPYPLSPANPYASASAPGPATPDSVDNNPAAMSPAYTSDPPYNPEFVNEQKKVDK